MQSKQILSPVGQVRSSICKEIKAKARKDGFTIDAPFIFEDCDALHAVITKNADGDLILTDEGYTLTHLGYYMDENVLWRGNRAEIVHDSAEMFGVTQEAGVFTLKIPDLTNAGQYYFDFIQCLIRISDITLLSRETVRTTFLEDFKAAMIVFSSEHAFPCKFDYHVPSDKLEVYKVDCFIETPKKPTYVFAIKSDDDCKDTAVAIYRFDKWGMQFNSLAVHEDAKKIGKKASAMLMDAVDKEISGLDSMNRFEDYLMSVV